MLEKTFNFADAEARLYEAWDQSGAFKPSGEGEPFTIVIPPPNVTGSLHMGHACRTTFEDVLSGRQISAIGKRRDKLLEERR